MSKGLILCKKYLFFVISVKTEIQMLKIVRDSHFRGNDNPVIIALYTGSMLSGGVIFSSFPDSNSRYVTPEGNLFFEV